jgi:hypothetical protein
MQELDARAARRAAITFHVTMVTVLVGLWLLVVVIFSLAFALSHRLGH